MKKLRVRGGAPLRGEAALPSDAAVAQRALAIAALCAHDAWIPMTAPGGPGGPGGPGAPVRSLARALRELGVTLDEQPGGYRVRGAGLHGLRAPSGALDAGASPLGFALIASLLSAQRFGTRVTLETLDASPAGALASALRARGAMIAEGNVRAPGPDGRTRASLAVAPLVDDEALRGVEHVLERPDELVKTALLVSGLFASGPTTVAEPLLSCDHTERWLSAAGVPVRRLGPMSGLDPSEWSGELAFAAAPPGEGPDGPDGESARVLELPGDTTIASAIACAASAIDGSRVRLDGVGWNATRTGALDALRLFGGRLRATARGDGRGFEPIAEAWIERGALRGGALDGELIVRAHDAAPLLAVLLTCSARGGALHDAAFCGALQPDPWRALAGVLAAFGARSAIEGGALRVEPARALEPARFDALGSPALALVALVLALIAPGESRLAGMAALDEHWPGLLGVLTALGARIEVEE